MTTRNAGYTAASSHCSAAAGTSAARISCLDTVNLLAVSLFVGPFQIL